MKSFPPVVVIKKSTYRSVYKIIPEILDLLNYTPKKDSIFIKPNLVDSYSQRSGIISSPHVIESIIKYIKERYPGKTITIGDGCAIHTTMEKVFAKSGYNRLVKRYGVSFIGLNQAEFRKRSNYACRSCLVYGNRQSSDSKLFCGAEIYPLFSLTTKAFKKIIEIEILV